MKSRDFCYWLQGYFEIESLVSNKPELPSLTAQQVAMIKNHLSMVFKHEIDPSFGREQSILDMLHKPPTVSGPFDGGAGGPSSGGPIIARC